MDQPPRIDPRPYRPVLAKQAGWGLPGPRALGDSASHFSPLLARPFGSPPLPAFADPGWSIQSRQGAFCSARCQRRLQDAKQRLTSGKYVFNKTAPCPDALSRRRGNLSLRVGATLIHESVSSGKRRRDRRPTWLGVGARGGRGSFPPRR